MTKPPARTTSATPSKRDLVRESVADRFRRWGYLQAQVDPLGRLQTAAAEELDALPDEEASQWRQIYCGSIGAEFMHIADPVRRAWIVQRMEAAAAPLDTERIWRQIVAAEVFERFLHSRYVGTKRYSLEGAAALIPCLNGLLDCAVARKFDMVVIGMSHRGRLTVMLQSVGVPAAHLFAGYADADPRSVLGGGDLKYHQGATGSYTSVGGRALHVHLVSNPSHLEAVNPVVLGRVRARQQRLGDAGIDKVLGITVHGDAAFAGQGVASETLNMASVPGFDVGGMLHVVVDNRIGFTTEPRSLHSSRFSTDVARRLDVPILHVNGEDPQAVVRVAQMAFDYRDEFHSDVVVDLICYRRWGHSEVDDPTTTQPLLYRAIEKRPRLFESYATTLGLAPAQVEQAVKAVEAELTAQQEKGRAMPRTPVLRQLPNYWAPYGGGRYTPDLEVPTHVAQSRLQEIATQITRVPDGFSVHPKLQKLLEQRRQMGRGERRIDWGMAEALAFGSLLWDGMLVRISGQDTRRGTFNHRHAVLVDFETGVEHVPLQCLHDSQGRFDVYDSTLAEASELGFAYGFSRDYPDALVCWEAQFGDFVNGAQVILDTFVCAGEDKWDLLSGLVLLLPHGYEGQGPEHSSARLERFLQLAAEDNWQVCQPSTAAQYFHLLRRQALRSWRKPLVILTPKGTLRAEAATSALESLSHGGFRTVIAEDEHSTASRILVCSGKIAHELRAERQRRNNASTAVVTLEQIYPFPESQLEAALESHEKAREIIWVQEEPGNMGALFYVRPRLQRLAKERRFTTVRRSESASPATGSAKAHALEQRALLELAFANL